MHLNFDLLCRPFLFLGGVRRGCWGAHRLQQFVQLLVVPDRQLDVARHDPRLLVIARGIARQLQHCCKIHRCARSHSLRESAVLHEPGDSSHGELQSRLARFADGLRRAVCNLASASFAFSCHFLGFCLIVIKLY